MTEAAQMADKINTHIANGGRVFSCNYRGAKEIGKAMADGISLLVLSGRSLRPVCIPAQVTADLRREWRNVEFR